MSWLKGEIRIGVGFWLRGVFWMGDWEGCVVWGIGVLIYWLGGFEVEV